jgi:hypothetical protein
VPRSSSPYQTPHCQLGCVETLSGRKVQVASASAPSQLRRQSSLSSSQPPPICSAPRLCPVPRISSIFRPACNVKYDYRGCAVLAVSCPSFDAVQHRLAASPVLRFPNSLAPLRPCLHILDLSFLHPNIKLRARKNLQNKRNLAS